MDHRPDGSERALGTTGDEPVPGYRLVTRRGRGGFGEVWEAEARGRVPRGLEDRPAADRGPVRRGQRPDRRPGDPPPEPAGQLRGVAGGRRADRRHGAGRPLALGPLHRGGRPGPSGDPPRRIARLPLGRGLGDRPPERAEAHAGGAARRRGPASRPQAAEHPALRRRRQGGRLRRVAGHGRPGRPEQRHLDARLRGPRVLRRDSPPTDPTSMPWPSPIASSAGGTSRTSGPT